jgi:hypothetical protein
MRDFYETRDELLFDFVSERPQFQSWSPELLYSTLVRTNPGLEESVGLGREPDYYTANEVLSHVREKNPDFAELSDFRLGELLKSSVPELADVWGFGIEHEPLEERDPEEELYDRWVGRRLEKPLSEYEDGQKLLELQRPQASSRLGRLWENFKGRGGRDWVPYGSEIMDTVELVTVANAYKTLLSDGHDENLSDEELLRLNLYLERATREAESGGWGKGGAALRQSMLFMTEFGVYAAATALAAANVFTGPVDDILVHTKQAGHVAQKVANKKVRSWLSKTLLTDAAADKLQTEMVKRGAVEGGKRVKRAHMGRMLQEGMKDSLTERVQQSLFRGSTTKAAELGSRFIGTQTINVGNAMIKAGGKELLVGGATAAATGGFNTRRSLQMAMSEMMEKGTPADTDYRIASYFDSVIEDYSEFLGDEILAVLGGFAGGVGEFTGATKLTREVAEGFGKKLRAVATSGAQTAEEALSIKQRLARGIIDMHAAGRFGGVASAREMLKDVGYNGIFGEFMEERVGDMIRGATGMEGDEEMNAFLRTLDVAWNKPGEDWLAEAIALITPMAATSAMRGGVHKVVEHTQGYRAHTQVLGYMTGEEALHRERRPTVRLVPTQPATKAEESGVHKYRKDWLDNLDKLAEAAEGDGAPDAKARLASIREMQEQVRSGEQDWYVLSQVRAGRDISTDGGPVEVDGPVVRLKPAPAVAPAQQDTAIKTGATDLSDAAQTVREAIKAPLKSGERQARSQGIILDTANRIFEWAGGVKFMFGENRTYGEGAGFELTPNEFMARQGAIDVLGKARMTFERVLAGLPGFRELRSMAPSQMTEAQSVAYENALEQAADAAAEQVMPMLNRYSGVVQVHAALNNAGWADLTGRAGLDPKSLRSRVKARKMEKKMSEVLETGVAQGWIIRDPAGRMMLAPESKQQFLAELGATGLGTEAEQSLAEELLEWRGISSRVLDAKQQRELGEVLIPNLMREGGAQIPLGYRVTRSNVPMAQSVAKAELAAAQKAGDAAKIDALTQALEHIGTYARAYGQDLGFTGVELEQARQAPSDKDTLSVILLRQMIAPNPLAPGFKSLLADMGYPDTLGGEQAFLAYLNRYSDILKSTLDASLVAEGTVVVPAEEADSDSTPRHIVTRVHGDGRFDVAELDANTGSAAVVVDADNNPVTNPDGTPVYAGAQVAAKGTFVRRAPKKVVFTRAPVRVVGTAEEMRAIGALSGDLTSQTPLKKGETPAADRHMILLDGQTSADGSTLFLSYNEAAVAEEILEGASKKAGKNTVPSVDGVAGFQVHKAFRQAVDEARERLAGQRRRSPAEQRLLNAINAKDPAARARNVFELQGKVAKYGILGFNEAVDRLGMKDSEVFRPEANTLIEMLRSEDGTSPVLSELSTFYKGALGGAEAFDLLRFRAGATVATEAAPAGPAPAPKPKEQSKIKKAKAALDAAIKSGDIQAIKSANEKYAEALKAAGVDTSSTRTTAYEREMKDQIRLANLAYEAAKTGGDRPRMREASKLREQLQASLRKAVELAKASKSRHAVQYGAAKRTGYGTAQYEVTKAAVTEMLLPELLRSGALTEAEAASLLSQDAGYADARTKLAEFFASPFKYLTIGKMEGEPVDVAEAMIDQMFGPLQYADGQLPPLPAPLGARTGMTDEQLAAIDQEFERATLMYDLSQSNEINQAMDGDAREAESTSRLHERIGRAILAERMGPYYAMDLDRMRTEGNVAGAFAFGLPSWRPAEQRTSRKRRRSPTKRPRSRRSTARRTGRSSRKPTRPSGRRGRRTSTTSRSACPIASPRCCGPRGSGASSRICSWPTCTKCRSRWGPTAASTTPRWREASLLCRGCRTGRLGWWSGPSKSIWPIGCGRAKACWR